MKKILFIYLFICFPIILFAQSPPVNIKFRHISLEEGLSQLSIYSMFQDSEGFMWFGTEDGLNKYDGYKFTVYKHDPNDSSSINSGSIFSICEGHEGTIWIGMDHGGLNAFNKKTGKFRSFQADPKDSGSLISNRVFEVFVDRDGDLWVGAGGLNFLKKGAEKFVRYRHQKSNIHSLSNNYIRSIYQDKEGLLWIGTSGGYLNAFDKKNEKFTRYSYLGTETADGIQESTILCITSDNRETIWAGTFGGDLISFDKRTGKFNTVKRDRPLSRNVMPASISNIYYDNNGVIWVCTQGDGLFAMNTLTGNSVVYKYDPLEKHSLSSNSISRIHEDRSGVFWVGTMGSGLCLFDKKSGKIELYKNNPNDPSSLSNNSINAVCEGKNGVIWVGTSGGGISALNRKNGKFTNFRNHPSDKNSLNDNNIGCLYEDQEGVLWVGTNGGGLNVKENNSNNFRKYQNNPDDSNSISPGSIKVLYEDDEGTIWIGMRGTAFDALDKKKMRFKQYTYRPNNARSLPNYNFRCIAEDNNGVLWLGTKGGGLYRMDEKTDSFTIFKNEFGNPFSLNNNNIMAIWQDDKGILWLGTFGGGLNAMVKDKEGREKFFHFTEKEGLSNNVVYGILPDSKGHLWMSTNNGICKFTPPADLEGIAPALFHSYDVNDGLPTNEFNSGAYCKSHDGWMFFGCIGGLVSFHPDSLKNNSYIPPVYITSFKLFEKEYPLDTTIIFKKMITLSYDQSFFSFEFTTLDYSLPLKNQFSYKMEGFDQDWIFIGNRRFASYTNLDPGSYVFRVRASNNDGVWNEKGAELKIIITPPWWKTWWFRISLFLTLIAIVFLYIRWREKSLREQKKELEIKVNERTFQLQEEKEKVEHQKLIVEEKNQNITDSINYAKRIQTAILPSDDLISQLLPSSFVYYQPKDIISGDFYWIAEKEEHVLISVADCTGHGVPGALMSMVGSSLLHQIVNEKTIKNPPEVLAELDKQIIRSLKQTGAEGESREGMDISFVEINKKSKRLRFSGANRPMYVISKGELQEIPGSQHPIGSITRKVKNFALHELQLKEGDSFFLFTDGFCDQFGEKSNKKFMARRLIETLISVHHLPMEKQKKELVKTINEWKGNFEQVDDICVVGVKV